MRKGKEMMKTWTMVRRGGFSTTIPPLKKFGGLKDGLQVWILKTHEEMALIKVADLGQRSYLYE